MIDDICVSYSIINHIPSYKAQKCTEQLPFVCESTIRTATTTAPPSQYNHPPSVSQDGSYPATPQSAIKRTNNPNNNINNNNTNNNINNNNNPNNTNSSSTDNNTGSLTKDDEPMTDSDTDNNKITADDYITGPVGELLLVQFRFYTGIVVVSLSYSIYS